MCSPHILRFVSMCVCETFGKKNKEFKASLMTSFTLLLKLAPKLRNSTKNSHGFYLRGQKNKTNFHENNLLQIYQKPAKSAKKNIYKKTKKSKKSLSQILHSE